MCNAYDTEESQVWVIFFVTLLNVTKNISQNSNKLRLQATRATLEVEKKCYGRGKASYKKCVKQVSMKCVSITKSLVGTLERQRAEVEVLTEVDDV